MEIPACLFDAARTSGQELSSCSGSRNHRRDDELLSAITQRLKPPIKTHDLVNRSVIGRTIQPKGDHRRNERLRESVKDRDLSQCWHFRQGDPQASIPRFHQLARNGKWNIGGSASARRTTAGLVLRGSTAVRQHRMIATQRVGIQSIVGQIITAGGFDSRGTHRKSCHSDNRRKDEAVCASLTTAGELHKTRLYSLQETAPEMTALDNTSPRLKIANGIWLFFQLHREIDFVHITASRKSKKGPEAVCFKSFSSTVFQAGC